MSSLHSRAFFFISPFFSLTTPEQLNNKHEERRVLVAESCGSLAPFVREELRASLILSIILQLVDDKRCVALALGFSFCLPLLCLGGW